MLLYIYSIHTDPKGRSNGKFGVIFDGKIAMKRLMILDGTLEGNLVILTFLFFFFIFGQDSWIADLLRWLR